MDNKKRLENKDGFLKTTAPQQMDSAQKASLNRKGNVQFNAGDIEGAKKLFLATGYSDGLSRVGDYYKKQDKLIDALEMYWIAHDRTKYEPMLMQLAEIVQNLLHTKEGTAGEDLDA